MEHRSSPDQGLVPGIEESDRNYLEPVHGEGLDAIVPQDFRLLAQSQHQRNVRSVDVGIEETDFVAHPGEDDRQVNGQSSLADSPLAGADGDDGIDTGQRLRTGRLLAGMMRMSAQIASFRRPTGSGRTLDYTGLLYAAREAA